MLRTFWSQEKRKWEGGGGESRSVLAWVELHGWTGGPAVCVGDSAVDPSATGGEEGLGSPREEGRGRPRFSGSPRTRVAEGGSSTAPPAARVGVVLR